MLIGVPAAELKQALQARLEDLVQLLEREHLGLAELLLRELLVEDLADGPLEILIGLLDLGVSERVEGESAALIDRAAGTIGASLLSDGGEQVGEGHQIPQDLQGREVVWIGTGRREQTLCAVVDREWCLKEVLVIGRLALLELRGQGDQIRDLL